MMAARLRPTPLIIVVTGSSSVLAGVRSAWGSTSYRSSTSVVGSSRKFALVMASRSPNRVRRAIRLATGFRVGLSPQSALADVSATTYGELMSMEFAAWNSLYSVMTAQQERRPFTWATVRRILAFARPRRRMLARSSC